MKNFKSYLFILFTIAAIVTSCSSIRKNELDTASKYKPDDVQLYQKIFMLDSAFFASYNKCDVDLNTYANFYSDSIEFFHDQNGLSTSKDDIVEATKRNICGKVRRELVKGSLEVYSIKGYGVLEIGFHKFHNNAEKEGTPSKASKFIIMWKGAGDNWKITKVVSLH
jgi:ketosteroid isomerase-like protein